jgi:hypothetical protein
MHTYHKNSALYILLLIPLCASLSAMEPVDMPGDDAHEAIPLLDEADEYDQEMQDIRLVMAMEDEDDIELDEQKSVFFDGSRRFYDDESRELARDRACEKRLKPIVFNSTLCTGITIGTATLAVHLCEWCRSLNVRDYAIMTSLVMSYFLIMYSIIDWVFEIKPAIAERNPFSYRKSCCNDEQSVTIPQAMIDAADSTKIIFCDQPRLQRGYATCSCPFFKKLRYNGLRRIFFSKKDIELHNKIQERLDNPCTPLREQYRNLAYQIKKLLVTELPRELIAHIFSNFPNQNILEHMLDHHPKDWWDKGICHLNEEELLLLMKKSSITQWEKFYEYGLSPYLTASVLAENGWVAFAKNKKYPIQCNMKFFNIYAMPNEHMKRYFAKFVNPTVYLPYSPQLAQYYKFEDDPAYALEHVNPTSKKIKHLLQLRQEIVARNPALMQPIPNNNIN